MPQCGRCSTHAVLICVVFFQSDIWSVDLSVCSLEELIRLLILPRDVANRETAFNWRAWFKECCRVVAVASTLLLREGRWNRETHFPVSVHKISFSMVFICIHVTPLSLLPPPLYCAIIPDLLSLIKWHKKLKVRRVHARHLNHFLSKKNVRSAQPGHKSNYNQL